jgi:hypothetical protein
MCNMKKEVIYHRIFNYVKSHQHSNVGNSNCQSTKYHAPSIPLNFLLELWLFSHLFPTTLFPSPHLTSPYAAPEQNPMFVQTTHPNPFVTSETLLLSIGTARKIHHDNWLFKTV